MDKQDKKALVVRSYFGKGDSEHVDDILPFEDTLDNRQAVQRNMSTYHSIFDPEKP